ncbi:MAG: hypothetical protein ACK5NC_09875 [Vibrio sp.]
MRFTFLIPLLFVFQVAAQSLALDVTVKSLPVTDEQFQSWHLKDTVKGYKMIDYELAIPANSQLSVDLTPSNNSNYFNILPKGEMTALFVGSAKGDHAELTIPKAGEYTIRVYLMRNAARREESSDFSLAVRLEQVVNTTETNATESTANMHSSWDLDGDGINDCEKDGSCDHTIDYSKPRK